MARNAWIAFFYSFVLGVIALASRFESAHGTLTNVTALCSPSANPPALKKGAATYVCINVNDNYRAVFMPVADKFTVLRVTDCAFQTLCAQGRDISALD